MKKFISLFLSAMILSVTALTAFAGTDELTVMPISAESPVLTVNVNDEDIEAKTYVSNDGISMIPLRAVCEKLGFTVTWEGETNRIILEKMPLYITMYTTEDGYTFSKTAPMKLGTPPVVVEGTTYVPFNFITEILNGYYVIDGERILIFFGEGAKPYICSGTVTEIIKKENGEVSQLVLNDNELILNVGESVEVSLSNGKKISLSDIEVGANVTAISKGMMTMSLPPQTPVYSIIVETYDAVTD